MRVKVANSPVSWGVDHIERPGLPPWPEVFDEIAAAGYPAVELGPFGYLPRDGELVRRELDDRGLEVVGSFLMAPVHDPDRRDEVLKTTAETCAFIAACGGSSLVIVDWGSEERFATAGRSQDATRMSSERWSAYLEVLNEIDRVAREHFGLLALAHPHAGTWLEFDDEIVALLEQTSLSMCNDTGHLAYAGADPVGIYERYPDRVPHLNFKDVDAEGRRRAVEGSRTFLEAVDQGVFCPIGSGIVDFPGLRVALERHGYDGYATVEQDRDPSGSTGALADARSSLEYLRSVGLADREDR